MLLPARRKLRERQKTETEIYGIIETGYNTLPHTRIAPKGIAGYVK